ncbi:hypothetical protein OIU76_003282 [Salix suchowensis]|nr:hypothetical protein OIU76_003282 [Salix suchowensis]
MEKYDPQVFRTSLLGESMIVFCGPAGNKFLFRNENKLLKIWWPSSVRRLLKSSLANMIGDEAKRMRSVLLTFLDPHALERNIERMDLATQNHIRTCWHGRYVAPLLARKS